MTLQPGSRHALTPSASLKPALQLSANPLAQPKIHAIDPAAIPGPAIHRLSRPAEHRRELKDLRRATSAAEALAGFTRETELFGFTKAQFSLVDLIAAALDHTGPADFALATWTASPHHIGRLTRLRDRGLIRSARFLLDYTFARRDPAAAQQLRQEFGLDSLALTQNHAKWVLLRNGSWSVVIRTSMNLNPNPRFENFDIAHDPPLADFLESLLQRIWKAEGNRLEASSTIDQRRHFRSHL